MIYLVGITGDELAARTLDWCENYQAETCRK